MDLNYGGITCTEVRQLLPMMMEMREIPEPQRSRMEIHLAECPHCRKLREQMMSPTAAQQPVGQEPSNSRLVASSKF